MSISTDGIICFGVICGEDVEFPWDAEEFDGDIEKWWLHLKGYQPLYQPFNSEGDYAEGWCQGDSRFTEYFEHKKQWLSANPVPVEIKNYCSDPYSIYAITVPNVGLKSEWGYPTTFEPSQLKVSKGQIEILKEFLVEYKILYEGEPQWILLSYHG